MKDEELNEILEQMAEEVPPMPADFHDRWMNAVRAEAKDTAPAAEDTTQRKTVSPVRLTRILSVAAAFVFLIGGTLLWRSSKQSLPAAVPAEKREAEAMTAAEEPDIMAAGTEATEEESAALYTAVQAPVAEEAAEADAAVEDVSLVMKVSGTAMNSFAAASGQAAGAGMIEEEAEEEADYAMEAVFDAEPAALEPAAATTAAPAAVPAGTPEPEKTGFLQAAGSFFTDMGDFLLAALPYLLVLAVPAAAALVIRRKKVRK